MTLQTVAHPLIRLKNNNFDGYLSVVTGEVCFLCLFCLQK